MRGSFAQKFLFDSSNMPVQVFLRKNVIFGKAFKTYHVISIDAPWTPRKAMIRTSGVDPVSNKPVYYFYSHSLSKDVWTYGAVDKWVKNLGLYNFYESFFWQVSLHFRLTIIRNFSYILVRTTVFIFSSTINHCQIYVRIYVGHRKFINNILAPCRSWYSSDIPMATSG